MKPDTNPTIYRKDYQQPIYWVDSMSLALMIEPKSTWLNAAGLGIVWLHIRMDTKPKYYKTIRHKDQGF